MKKIEFKIKDGKKVLVSVNSEINVINSRNVMDMIAGLIVQNVHPERGMAKGTLEMLDMPTQTVEIEEKEIEEKEIEDNPAEENSNEEVEVYSKPKIKGYRGYMHLKCDKCGRIQSFNSHEEIEERECNCGHIIPLYHLKRISYQCSTCGKDYTYWTNREELDFDIVCKDCKSKNIVRYNADLDAYENE